MENRKRNLFQGCFLLLLIILTFYILLKDEDIFLMKAMIRQTSPVFIALAAVAASGRIFGEAGSLFLVLKNLNIRISFLKCVKYALIGFYFCAITPSATGGQPAQVYYMKKEHVDLAASGSALIVMTIAYKVVLTLFGVAAFVFLPHKVFRDLGHISWLFYFAIILNILLVLLFSVLLFSRKIVGYGMKWVLKLAVHLPVGKEPEQLKLRCERFVERYHEGADYLKKHQGTLTGVFLCILLQRILMFSVTYFVYRSFGLKVTALITILLMQSIVAICADVFPLPGGVGISEQCYLAVFAGIFTKRLVLPSMILSRGISFYILAAISGLVVCYVQLHLFHKPKKAGRNQL